MRRIEEKVEEENSHGRRADLMLKIRRRNRVTCRLRVLSVEAGSSVPRSSCME